MSYQSCQAAALTLSILMLYLTKPHHCLGLGEEQEHKANTGHAQPGHFSCTFPVCHMLTLPC